MASCDLRIVLEEASKTYQAGGKIAGKVVVHVDAEVQCNDLVVVVELYTHGKGNRRTKTLRSESLFKGKWLPGDFEYPFELEVPSWPPAYAGELLNIAFQVCARADIPWAFDPKAEEDIVVVREQPAEGLELSWPDDVVQKDRESNAGCFGCGLVLLGAGLALVVIAVVTEEVGLVQFAFPALLVGLIGFLSGLGKWWAERKVGRVRVDLERQTPGGYRDAPGAGELGCAIHLQKRSAVNEVTAVLEIREQVVRGSGTNRTTYRHSLHKEELRLESQDGQTYAGRIALPDPRTVPYSFSVPDNKILWELSLRVDIPDAPDWKQAIVLQANPVKQLGSSG